MMDELKNLEDKDGEFADNYSAEMSKIIRGMTRSKSNIVIGRKQLTTEISLRSFDEIVSKSTTGPYMDHLETTSTARSSSITWRL